MSRSIEAYRASRASSLCGLLCLLWVTACASFSEEYYLAAEDPMSGATNYFRIRIKGRSTVAKVKYSVGFYERDAVEELFGERAIQDEYKLVMHGDEEDAQMATKLDALSLSLRHSEYAGEAMKRQQLERASEQLFDLLGRYRVKLHSRGPGKESYLAYVERASALRDEAERALLNGESLHTVATKLREAQGLLEAIRVAVDGDVIVRFFDGAGNEIDVEGKSTVIFVATDVSRFTEAIRQLGEAEGTSRAILEMVLGPRIEQARRLDTGLRREEERLSLLLPQLDATTRVGGENAGEDSIDAEELGRVLERAASLVAGMELNSAAEIRAAAGAER